MNPPRPDPSGVHGHRARKRFGQHFLTDATIIGAIVHAIAPEAGQQMVEIGPGLAAMTTPVWAVYASDADGGAPAAMADALWSREYAALPGVTLKRVDGARHFIMVDQPDRLDALVDAFLKRED